MTPDQFLPTSSPPWATAARRVLRTVGRPHSWAQWLAARPARITTLLWLLGLIMAGTQRMALAQDIITTPDLAKGAPLTLFERFDLMAYGLTIEPSNASESGLGLDAVTWGVVGVLNTIVLWIVLGVVYGALAMLEWFLNLTVYHDAAPQLDQATQMIGDTVFWPLIACTAAIGLFQAYAKWRTDDRSPISAVVWVIAAAVLGVGWSQGPSVFMEPVDEARQSVGAGVMTGASDFVGTSGNPTGYPEPNIPAGTQEGGTRRLVNSMWNTYGATPWCWAQFKELDICREAGHHYLAQDEQWKEWQAELEDNGSPAVFREYTDFVRGEDLNRTLILLLMLVLALPIGLLIGVLVFHGLKALVGLLIAIIVGVVFLAFWCIDGEPRRWGIKYLAFTIGLELQALFLTIVVAAVMVVSTILGNLVGGYGFFVVGIFNIAAFWFAAQMRGWLEALSSTGGAGSMGYGTMLAARSITRTVTRGISRAAALAGAAVGGAGVGAAQAAKRASAAPQWAGEQARSNRATRAVSPLTRRGSERLVRNLYQDARKADDAATKSPRSHAQRMRSAGYSPSEDGQSAWTGGMVYPRVKPTSTPPTKADFTAAGEQAHRWRTNQARPLGDPLRHGPPPGTARQRGAPATESGDRSPAPTTPPLSRQAPRRSHRGGDQ